jgi:hypothetical protein
MNKYYDYVIVGAGPTGLTLALYLSKYNYKVALIDKEESIGGCHSVKRVNGLFSEHGPRIYLDNYLIFSDILKKELNTSFTDLFTPYKFGKKDIFNRVFLNLPFRELIIFSFTFLNLNKSYQNISFKEYLDYHNFSEKSVDMLDRLGRLTDGGGIEKYTLYSFLQIMNQNILYDIYQPKLPNDIGLFKIWQDELVNRGVDIYLDSQITKINTKKDKIISLSTNDSNYIGKNFIFAIPPINISNLFEQNNLDSGFEKNFTEWADKTNYNTYIPIIFHWNTKINLKKLWWGYPESSWGVGHIVLSDYMDFKDPRSKTVISCIISKPDKSDFLHKTPNEITDKRIIIEEVFRQLKSVLPELPDYDNVVMSQNYHDGKEWKPIHTAFMTTKYGYIDFNSDKYTNLFNCGVHNGKSSYSFTSLESSVANAVELLYKLVPESKNDIKIREAVTLRVVLLIIFLLLTALFFIFNSRK